MTNLLDIFLIKIVRMFMKIIALMSKVACFDFFTVSIINIRLKLLEAMPENYLFYFDVKYFRLLG